MMPRSPSLFVLTALCLGLLALGLAGCKNPLAGGPTPQPGQVLFQDDFSSPSSGWNRVSEASGEADYADGKYRILVSASNLDIWARPGLDFTGVQVEVDALKVGGDRNNRFGIICRVNRPPGASSDSFYAFLISSDGYFGIGKIKGDNYSLLGASAMQPSEKIAQGSETNHLRADCVGPNLALYVNGTKIAEAQDDEFKSGDVGLIAGTYHLTGTDIRFDQFTVLQR